MSAIVRSPPRWVAAALAAVGVVLLTVVGATWTAGRRPRLAPDTGLVVVVIDGDTLVVRLRHGEERVRLIGVDTPETVDPARAPECFGAEASARTTELLPPGTEIRLERDVEGRDRYGRLLAYVFRTSDGLLINRVLLEEGLGEPLHIAPNTAYRADLAAAGADARAQGRGLWSACARDPPG